jgi:Xaa-Pro aminopeptidase
MKQGLPETLEIIPWLSTQLAAGEKVAVNAEMFSVSAFASMKSELKMSGIELVSLDLIKEVWTGKPALPQQPFFVFDTNYAGKSAAEKLMTVRAELRKAKADYFVLSALDDIAWLYNIRGNDVSYNPVVIAYSLVEEDKATLFIAPEKLTEETKAYLQDEGVQVAPYLSIYNALQNIPKTKSVLIDGAKLNQSLFEAIPAECAKRNTMSPVFKLKSIKNEVEMTGVRRAMIKMLQQTTYPKFPFRKNCMPSAANRKISKAKVSEQLPVTQLMVPLCITVLLLKQMLR